METEPEKRRNFPLLTFDIWDDSHDVHYYYYLLIWHALCENLVSLCFCVLFTVSAKYRRNNTNRNDKDRFQCNIDEAVEITKNRNVTKNRMKWNFVEKIFAQHSFLAFLPDGEISISFVSRYLQSRVVRGKMKRFIRKKKMENFSVLPFQSRFRDARKIDFRHFDLNVIEILQLHSLSIQLNIFNVNTRSFGTVS